MTFYQYDHWDPSKSPWNLTATLLVLILFVPHCPFHSMSSNTQVCGVWSPGDQNSHTSTILSLGCWKHLITNYWSIIWTWKGMGKYDLHSNFFHWTRFWLLTMHILTLKLPKFIFRCILVNEKFWLKFHGSLFLRVQFTITQLRFR